jgi:hypothetical protein
VFGRGLNFRDQSFRTTYVMSTPRDPSLKSHNSKANRSHKGTKDLHKDSKFRLDILSTHISRAFALSSGDKSKSSAVSDVEEEKHYDSIEEKDYRFHDLEMGKLGPSDSQHDLTEFKSRLTRGNSIVFEDFKPSLYSRVKSTLTRYVFSLTVEQLKFYLITSLCMYSACALVAMIVAASIMGSSLWSQNIAQTQLWTGVCVLLVSTVIIMINFAGFIGVYYQCILFVLSLELLSS